MVSPSLRQATSALHRSCAGSPPPTLGLSSPLPSSGRLPPPPATMIADTRSGTSAALREGSEIARRSADRTSVRAPVTEAGDGSGNGRQCACGGGGRTVMISEGLRISQQLRLCAQVQGAHLQPNGVMNSVLDVHQRGDPWPPNIPLSTVLLFNTFDRQGSSCHSGKRVYTYIRNTHLQGGGQGCTCRRPSLVHPPLSGLRLGGTPRSHHLQPGIQAVEAQTECPGGISGMPPNHIEAFRSIPPFPSSLAVTSSKLTSPF